MKPLNPASALRKSARRGHKGYPVGTIAFYGPDDTRASKVVLGVIAFDGAEPVLTKWFSETADLRRSPRVLRAILDRLHEAKVRSVSMIDRIIGCPHEEGVDYPDGECCPVCTFWAGRDRFTGERHTQ